MLSGAAIPVLLLGVLGGVGAVLSAWGGGWGGGHSSYGVVMGRLWGWRGAQQLWGGYGAGGDLEGGPIAVTGMLWGLEWDPIASMGQLWGWGV